MLPISYLSHQTYLWNRSFALLQAVYLKIIFVRRIKRYRFLSPIYHASIRATVYNVSDAHISRGRRIDYRVLSNIRSRTFDVSPRTILAILYLRDAMPARNKKTSSTARTRARGSCELKDRTVINNRFLPAPVCAAPGKASTQGEIFFVEALQEVDGGENVGHKNVPVRNGPGEEETRRVRLYAGDRTFRMASRSGPVYRGFASLPSRLYWCALSV